jgi:hypothetical protein
MKRVATFYGSEAPILHIVIGGEKDMQCENCSKLKKTVLFFLMFEDLVLRNAEQNVPVSGVPIHTHLASNILSKGLAFCVTALHARSRARSHIHSVNGSTFFTIHVR